MLNTPDRRRGGDRGVTIALTALLLLPLLAAAALAVDLGGWFARASEIQRAADAASLAGVTFLPQGVGQATIEAERVATRNGFTDGVGGVTVTVTDVGQNRLRVTITKIDVQQSISRIFRDGVTVTRSSTAEYIQPVPMGSPRNYLGTHQPQGSGNTNPTDGIAAANQENFWLSVSGYCARREHGDRITPRADSNGGAFEGCVPSGGSGVSGVIANPEFRANGYFYAVEIPDSYAAGQAVIQVYDAPQCQYEGSTAGDSGADGGSSAARSYTWTLRDNNSLNPASATPLFSRTISPADCGTMAGNWQTLFTIGAPTPGIYFLQIQPDVPANQTGSASQEGQNQFSLRIADSGGFTACSGDANITPNPSPGTCPNLYGLTHLGVYAQGAGNPSFFLASVGDEHSGKTMQIELFDTAEGADTIQLRDPTGTAYPFTWEIACMDGTFQSESGSCGTGEVAPPAPGYGPVANVTTLNVSGANNAWRPWGPRNIQNGRYSDRLIRLTVRLPGHPASPFPGQDISDTFGPLTWWKIAYTCGSCGDRTTWSVNILGDPVRLVPNS